MFMEMTGIIGRYMFFFWEELSAPESIRREMSAAAACYLSVAGLTDWLFDLTRLGFL